MNQYLIKNATIIDGSGKPGYTGSVSINNGTIQSITSVQNYMPSKSEIDATGYILAPGFIDVSNHADTTGYLFEEPDMLVSLSQGVTTLVGGNCGTSIAPLFNTEAVKALSKWGYDVSKSNPDWHSLKEFFEVLRSRPPAVNFATLVGYSTIHRTISAAERPLTVLESKEVKNIIGMSLDEGAIGVSFGLAFSRMSLVSKSEMKDLAKLIASQNKILCVHMRHDGEDVLDAMTECLDLAEETGVKIHINHLKVIGKKNWKYNSKIHALMLTAINNPNISISFDVFPYNASNPLLYLLLPEWLTKHGRRQMLEQLQQSSVCSDVIAEMQANGFDYNRMIVSQSNAVPSVVGSNILQIAHNQGVSVEEAILSLIRATDGRARVVLQSIDQNALDEYILNLPSIIASDGSGYGEVSILGKRFDHPRSFATFPKFIIDYCLNNSLSMEEAIHRITHLPATRFGLNNRGIIREGAIADLVLFNPNGLSAPATYANPAQLCQGMHSVWVGGELAYSEEKGVINPHHGSIIQNN